MLPETDTERNSGYKTEYQIRGQATIAQRRKAGLYPTKQELAAARKATYRGGDANLTADDIRLLAGCKWMAASLQAKYQAMVAVLDAAE